jgi:hypothetical protein
MSYKFYEDSGYGLDLDMLTISYYSSFHILGKVG